MLVASVSRGAHGDDPDQCKGNVYTALDGTDMPLNGLRIELMCAATESGAAVLSIVSWEREAHRPTDNGGAVVLWVKILDT